MNGSSISTGIDINLNINTLLKINHHTLLMISYVIGSYTVINNADIASLKAHALVWIAQGQDLLESWLIIDSKIPKNSCLPY